MSLTLCRIEAIIRDLMRYQLLDRTPSLKMGTRHMAKALKALLDYDEVRKNKLIWRNDRYVRGNAE